MGDILSFDGTRHRCSAATANRYAPKNKAEIVRIVGAWYGGLTATQIARREHIGNNAVERIVRQNSRPVGVQPLAISYKLRRAA